MTITQIVWRHIGGALVLTASVAGGVLLTIASALACQMAHPNPSDASCPLSLFLAPSATPLYYAQNPIDRRITLFQCAHPGQGMIPIPRAWCANAAMAAAQAGEH